MLGRIMMAIALVGLAVLAAAGVQGSGGVARGESSTLHVALALGGLLTLLLAHGWIVYYLTGVRRVIADVSGQAAPVGRAALPLVLAVVAALACFLLGVAAFGQYAPGWIHVALFALTVVCELWALVASWRALGATDRAFDELRRPSV